MLLLIRLIHIRKFDPPTFYGISFFVYREGNAPSISVNSVSIFINSNEGDHSII